MDCPDPESCASPVAEMSVTFMYKKEGRRGRVGTAEMDVREGRWTALLRSSTPSAPPHLPNAGVGSQFLNSSFFPRLGFDLEDTLGVASYIDPISPAPPLPKSSPALSPSCHDTQRSHSRPRRFDSLVRFSCNKMYFNSLSALALLAAIAGSNAQSGTSSAAAPTSTSGISSCIITCFAQAASANGCSGITDVSCLCSNTGFQQAARSCLSSNCSAADVQVAEALLSAECAAAIRAASASSFASSVSSASSGDSVISTFASSISSALSGSGSSVSSRLSTALSSVTGIISSVTSSAGASATSNAAGSIAKLLFGNSGGLIGVAVSAVGVLVGAGLVL
ncbi:hypothetical protein ACG7TL_008387 [Trametes sanguinea]